MELSSHDRIMRIFAGKEIDRPALKLWGAGLNTECLHPAYQPVCERAAAKSDLFVGAGSPFNVYSGRDEKGQITCRIMDTDRPTWKDKHITFHTAKGDLHSIERISTCGEPSYTIEYMVKEPEDLDKLLTLDYQPFPFSKDDYLQKQSGLGNRGVVLFQLDHAGYALQRLTGSENLAYFSVDCHDKLEEVISLYAGRIRAFARQAVEAGIAGPFQWVGPELFIPPLMSPQHFDDFIVRHDKLLCDDIHNAGGYVWVHCHGKVASFIERFIAMGVDILNPLEPSPNGDINLDECINRYSNRIGWEGNIEIQDILQAEPDHLKELIQACVEAGNRSGRFILCPSAGFMEYPFPTRQYIDNLLLYLRFGWDCVERCRRS